MTTLLDEFLDTT